MMEAQRARDLEGDGGTGSGSRASEVEGHREGLRVGPAPHVAPSGVVRALVVAPDDAVGGALVSLVSAAGCAAEQTADAGLLSVEDDGKRFDVVLLWVGAAQEVEAALAMRRLRWSCGAGLIVAVVPWSSKHSAWSLIDDPLLDHLVSWPAGAERLTRLVRAHVAERSLWVEEEEERSRLEGQARDLADRNRKLLLALGSQRAGAVKGLLAGLETRSALLREHALKTAQYARRIAAELRLRPPARLELSIGALIHDVGMLALPDDVLVHPGDLGDEDRAVLELHPRLGQRVALEANLGPEAAAVALAHHERWDGSGYPCGLAREAIPLLARVVAVADAFAAMTSRRPWRPPLPVDEARRRVASEAGKQFDPECVRAFERIPEEAWVRLGAGR